MKRQLLEQILKKKKNKNEFAIITNISNGESCIFEKNRPLDKNFEKYSDKINNYFNKKKNGIIENTDIFVESYLRPIKVIFVIVIFYSFISFNILLPRFKSLATTKFFFFNK